jgi:uncharacterized protein
MPTHLSWLQGMILFFAALLGGGINALAGGGTMIVFPALLGTGHTLTVANVTSTVALGSGQWTSMVVRWRETTHLGKGIFSLLALGFLGSSLGVYLFLHTSENAFKKIVPFLLLFATLLFLFQDKIAPKPPVLEKSDAPATFILRPPMILPLLMISIYGGYFGAGMGIMTLATLAILGERDLLRMTIIKNAYMSSVTFLATILFIVTGKIAWHSAMILIVGAMLGGYAGVGIAQKLGKKNLRYVVITVGFLLTSYLFYRVYFSGN